MYIFWHIKKAKIYHKKNLQTKLKTIFYGNNNGNNQRY